MIKRTTIEAAATSFKTVIPKKIIDELNLSGKDKVVWSVDEDYNITISFEFQDRSDEWED